MAKRRVRLTLAMLDAMLTALCEFEAGGEPQGFDSEQDTLDVMRNAQRAIVWIHDEIARRKDNASLRPSKED